MTASDATLSGATDARNRVTPCSRAAQSKSAAIDLGRDALAPVLGLDVVADLDPAVGSGRRVEPDRPDDPAAGRLVVIGQRRSPGRATAAPPGRPRGRRSGTGGSRRGGPAGRLGTAAPISPRGAVEVAVEQRAHERHRHARRARTARSGWAARHARAHHRIRSSAGRHAPYHRQNVIHSGRTFSEPSRSPDAHRRPRHRPVATPISLRDRLLGWKEILETANPPETRPLDTVGKWLVITRAAVFPMTIWSGPDRRPARGRGGRGRRRRHRRLRPARDRPSSGSCSPTRRTT